MTAGGRKKSLRAMVVAGNYNGVAGNKIQRRLTRSSTLLSRDTPSRVGPVCLKDEISDYSVFKNSNFKKLHDCIMSL